MNSYETVLGGSGEVFVDGRRVGTLDNISVDFGQEVKFFQGDMLYDSAALVTKRSCTVKAQSKTFDGDLLAASFLGITPAVGETLVATEAFAAGTTYTVTNGSTFIEALEVRNSVGQRMAKVASNPVLGESYVISAAGVLTLATGELGGTIQYQYTGTGGKTASGVNSKIGKARTVKVVVHNAEVESAKPVGIVLYAVVPTKPGSLGFKLADFADGVSFEGQAIAANGKVFDLFYEVA